MQAIILSEADLRQCISIDEAVIDAIEDGFTTLSTGSVTMPPIMRLDIPDKNAEVDIKTAYVPSLDSFAIKMSPGFFDNHKLGLPSTSGLMVLLSAETGFVKSVLLDNGYLTDVRTGAAGAVAARHLAPEQVHTAGVIGSGAQARYQIMALTRVRDVQRLLVFNRTRSRAEQYADDMQTLLGMSVMIASSAEEVVRNSSVVVTTTPARDGYLKPGWLHPGLHITAMGSDAENKQELDSQVFQRADVIVCDRKSQSIRLGELHHAVESGILKPEDPRIIELGEITSGQQRGRTHPEQITICDLTGTGMQDTVIAQMAYEKARQQDFGLVLDLR